MKSPGGPGGGKQEKSLGFASTMFSSSHSSSSSSLGSLKKHPNPAHGDGPSSGHGREVSRQGVVQLHFGLLALEAWNNSFTSTSWPKHE